MPQAAKAHTKAGAKAFVEYFWQVADYGQSALDAGAVRALVSPGCQPCNDAIGFIERVASRGGRISGGATTLSDFRIHIDDVGSVRLATVAFAVANTDQTVTYPSRKNNEHYPAGKARDRFTLGSTNRGWQVVGWQVHK